MTEPEETQWIDAWIRWERDSKDVYDQAESEKEQEEYLLSPTTTFTFEIPHHPPIVVRGFPSDSEAIWNSTGLTPWKSSTVLHDFLMEQATKKEDSLLPDGSTVLELGSGLGQTGIVLRKLYPNCRIYLTDGDTNVLKLLRANVQDNHCDNPLLLSCHQLMWGQHTAMEFQSRHKQHNVDVILGSDLIYVETVIPLLMETLQTLLNKPNGIFWMAHCCRSEGNAVMVETIWDAAHAAGLETKFLSTNGDVSLMEFRWRTE